MQNNLELKIKVINIYFIQLTNILKSDTKNTLLEQKSHNLRKFLKNLYLR